MHELKLALLKDKDSPINKSKDTSALRSNNNKSKSKSMWVFDDDSQQISEKNLSEKFNDSTYFLQSKLMQQLKKDKKITQTIFDQIVQEFQQLIGQGKNQISYLLVIEDKLTDLIDYMSGQKKKFFQQFIEMVQRRISEIRKKEKKNYLLEFDKIVNNNFKKKIPLLQLTNNNSPNTFLSVNGAIRLRQKSASKSRQKSIKNNRNQSKQKSSQKPLNKLLLKQKHMNKQKHNEEDDNINQTHADQTQQSMSYSVIMSASCAVKQRNRPRRNTKRKGELEMHQNNREQEGNKINKGPLSFIVPKRTNDLFYALIFSMILI